MSLKRFLWIFWVGLTVAGGAFFYYQFQSADDKSMLLIGDTTHGHFQIEMACATCHTEAFGGTEVLQDACQNCHAAELAEADDSHPKSKFNDPRNADRLEILDARYCVTCHKEHQKESTFAMGVTLPDDYCYHCHTNIYEDRPSHQGMEFKTCADSGCHNYHDNRALYEDFLVANAHAPELFAEGVIPQLPGKVSDKKLSRAAADAPENHLVNETVDAWHSSAHAEQGIQCSDCHTTKSQGWVASPSIDQCEQCHKKQTQGFTTGKHGMRLASAVSPVQTAVAPGEVTGHSSLSFQDDSLHLTHGCNSCHKSHEYNTKTAAVDSCLGCHNDQHSMAYTDSPHAQLWQQELAGAAPAGTGVSCATCHMPRLKDESTGLLFVQHNQNANLRPNEKMIRSVCMNCHGLSFSIDALADDALLKNNFQGRPQNHVKSIDMAIKRAQ